MLSVGRGLRLLSVVAVVSLTEGQALARVVKGPVLGIESMLSPSAVEPVDKDEPKPDVELKSRRTDANLLVPIPLPVLGGMFVAKLDFFKEHRELSGDGAPASMPNSVENPNVAGLGAVYLPHAKEGAPRFFVVTERYGSMSFTRRERPMMEFVLGADIADDDMPFSLRINDDDSTDTRVLVRLRRFPGFDRWLLLVGHKIEMRSGFSIDAAFPSHLIFGWQTEDQAWKVYGGVKANSREYPVDFEPGRGWIDGYAAMLFLGLRRNLKGPLYLALEGGLQKESLRFMDEKGKELAETETKFAPWARLALETWVETPAKAP